MSVELRKLNIPKQVLDKLVAAGIDTVADILKVPDDDLLYILTWHQLWIVKDALIDTGFLERGDRD